MIFASANMTGRATMKGHYLLRHLMPFARSLSHADFYHVYAIIRLPRSRLTFDFTPAITPLFV